MDIKTFVSIASKLPASQAILIRGPHGIGKSHLAKQIASNVSLPIIDKRLAQMTEGDVIGLPKVDDEVTRFLPLDWLLRACREPVVLLLDEINRATIEVQQCAFQLVLDREMNGNVLHKDTRIICAVNDSHEYQINDMDPALLDRFWVTDLDPTTEDWIVWASDNGIDEIIIDFIRHYPAHLRHTGAIEQGKIYPTPRSYEKLNLALEYAEWVPSDLAGSTPPAGLYSLSTGFLGNETSIAFQDFIKNYKLQISADDILNKWSKVESRVMKLSNDKHNALIEKLVTHCKDNDWTLDQATSVATFIKMLPGEMIVDFFNNILTTGHVENIKFVHNLIGEIVVNNITAASEL
tara:strand:- start:231 stop:1280 length:1050 start_codon:yes stop_codon:yes gene_type:complete